MSPSRSPLKSNVFVSAPVSLPLTVSVRVMSLVMLAPRSKSPFENVKLPVISAPSSSQKLLALPDISSELMPNSTLNFKSPLVVSVSASRVSPRPPTDIRHRHTFLMLGSKRVVYMHLAMDRSKSLPFARIPSRPSQITTSMGSQDLQSWASSRSLRHNPQEAQPILGP